LVLTQSPLGPPPADFLLAVSVVPQSQPTDSSHFHSLRDAFSVFPVPTGTDVVITIEPGASPDAGLVTVTANNLTIQGDPNVPAAILPTEQLAVNAHNDTLFNLNLGNLTLGPSAGSSTTFQNQVTKCIIDTLTENGTRSTFTQNIINGSAHFNGLESYQSGNFGNDDQVTNNTFTSEINPLLSVSHCDGINISQDTFYGATTAITMVNCGEGGGFYCTLANNTIITSGAGSTGVVIVEQNENNDGFTWVYVDNNTLHTNQGTGLLLACAIGDVGHFSVFVQGNDFHNNAVGVSITGGGTNCGVIDLGGGANQGLGSSLGGNDFRGFTKQGTAAAAAIVLQGTGPTASVSAAANMFSPGVSPPFVVDDGVEGSLTGTGQINAAAKLSDAQAFVQGLYNDLLGRTGNLNELTYWVNILNSQSQTAVANGLLRSSEALGRIVDSLYLRFLGRNADANGRAYWINLLQHGSSLESVESGFLTSPEYLNHIDIDFVQSLYINLLGRTGNASELAAWHNQIQTVGLAGIANEFLSAQEYRADNVNMDFASFLHRPPLASETSTFVNMQTDLLGIEAAILSSPECFTNI